MCTGERGDQSLSWREAAGHPLPLFGGGVRRVSTRVAWWHLCPFWVESDLKVVVSACLPDSGCRLVA